MESEILEPATAPPSVSSVTAGCFDGSALALRRVLESIGLEAPPEAILEAAGGGLWLRFDERPEEPLLQGLHPDRLLRACFACDIWAMRSHLLSANLIDFLRIHARPELPIVVDIDLDRWRALQPTEDSWTSDPSDTSDTSDTPNRLPGRLVVTSVDTISGKTTTGEATTGEATTGPDGGWVCGYGPDGRTGRWPASRVRTAACRHPEGPVGSATLHQPLVRQIDIDPRRLVRHGLRRVVYQMRQSIPSLGATGFAVLTALRRHLADGGPMVPGTPMDLGRGSFGRLLHMAADLLERPTLATAAGLFESAAEAWWQLDDGTASQGTAVRRLDAIEALERSAIDHLAESLAPAVRVVVGDPPEVPPQAPSLADYDHRRGVHCASMALHNLAHHYLGRKWSEALCFGLASGLNFTYLREPGSPMFLLMGRGSDMEEHFTEAVGGHLETFRSDDDERAWDHLLQQLEADRLVVLEADMFHLPYMVQSLELMEGVHFGGHKLFVTGYDAAAGSVVVQDYAWKEAITLPLEQLRLARGSRDCPEPPRNGCFVFHFPDQPTPLEEAVPRALRTLVQQMRRPFMQWNGLPAIERFCRQAARWSRVMGAEELELNVRLAGFMFERAGTGGGNFRNLYHRFLRQAAELIDAPELADAAGLYRRLAIAWRQVAVLLDEAAEDPSQGLFDPRREPQALLNEIRTLESQAIDVIDDYLQRRETL